MPVRLYLNNVGKSFTMHLQGGSVIPVVDKVEFSVNAGECAVLGGPSGAGKSSILKMIYGNYRCDQGQILVTIGDDIINVAGAEPRRILKLREDTIGYVSQFLRTIPRVSAEDVVAEPLVAQGTSEEEAVEKARSLLTRLNVPERLWTLPPATFSGGEQQRVNIARGFIAHYPILLLDEPTASLDAANRAVVVRLVQEKKEQGVAMVGILHDQDVREEIADRIIDVTGFAAEVAA
ncbi:MAG: phosphonate C-P lyase system protein PhnL [Roseibium album]|uniref:phosphonate C-P lyase system protein PhnL n=1 Tax=Roseibium album TaxID=311410 RepID=UPI000CF04503|nr:phosphonate C-P lyase system protein PhnL [Roseibium album]MBG6144005.1 alpha-D-ribose 1-methylphosphonate 5-triphosphate synthase subunit PhnL [Labrenzia sp. EL_142]MBG6157519.1 alpha-D-ribose 1-methylphosphonate 5-triphosphate synthase subunit PhnL [Labrenzia sp. EL_162]MBG6174653.1 alpha-D-ribose 1-methylphosphonate 5-triphosphate synthase subunit PhnL [Labrenzia sp. EL_132]MBG6196087.1 alpha-D-ribose 1-methylphosphonate 5-triphosphate synthase subunit PhnL [Labrenzia sp. EL_159]MBG62015